MKEFVGSISARKIETSGASSLDKGIPFGFTFEPEDIAHRHINILDEALHFPLLVLKESALSHNLSAMAQWCVVNKLFLAPHGKTTMTPRIFERQLEHGAWGITVSTASQALVCFEMGIKRILIANQIIGHANIQTFASMMKADPALELLCLTDSIDGTEILASEWLASGVGRPIGVLVEMGRLGWRTGARSLDTALQLCTEVAKYPGVLAFRGIEGFEGLAHASEPLEEGRQVDEFLASIAALGLSIQAASGARGGRLLLSVGGSGFLDAVWKLAQQVQQYFHIILRSGCYVTHDHGYYSKKLVAAHERAISSVHLPMFRPALELWSHVQSKPEAGLAILNFGKRDCAYDAGLPIPLFARSRQSPTEKVDLKGVTIVNTNDQHAYLNGPKIEQLRVGDQVCCGISHPCTAFDKWRVLPVVDDSYRLLDIYRTYF